MRVEKKGVILALIAVMTFVFLTLSPNEQSAKAGTSGQQIRFDCSFMRGSIVTIIGSNQNGKVVTWQQSNVSTSIVTSGWWWKGWVRISYRNPGQNTISQQVNVPRVQPYSDIFYARC